MVPSWFPGFQIVVPSLDFPCVTGVRRLGLGIESLNAFLQSLAMKILLALFLLSAAFLNAAEERWQTYTNARFGFRLVHPPGLVASRPPENGDGREFHTKDKEFSLRAYGHFLQKGDTLEKLWNEELKDLGAAVTYKKKGADWYVVSGVKDGTEFYHKTFTKEGNFSAFRITYPHAKAKQYDPWVERIAKSFVPFLKGDFDRIVK